MEPDPPSRSPRKVRFAPKAPPRRAPRLNTTKTEEDGGDDNESQQSLNRRVSEHLAKREGRVEKKSPLQVAFSHGVASTSIRSFGRKREKTDDGNERTNDGSIADYSEGSATGEMQETQGVADYFVDLTDAAIVKNKEYREPWDYQHSNYPIALPHRRPGSGDPDVLDKAEFEEAPEYDENAISSASELGLLDQDDKSRMLVFTFPSDLPLGIRPTNASSRETDDNLKAVEKSVKSEKGKGKGKAISLEELPEGRMGKMLVYKSGAVKLKLGDILYDVSSGSDSSFSQKVMAINVKDKQCCELGEANKKAVVTPDIDSLLDSEID